MSTQQNSETNDTPGVVQSTRLRDDIATPRQAGSRFYTLLVQMGIPAALAAAIIGGIYAALVALGVLALPGCRASVDLLPDGAQRWEGIVAWPTVTEMK